MAANRYAWWFAMVCGVAGGLGELRRRLNVRGGGEMDNFFSSKGYMAPEDRWFSEQMSASRSDEETSSALAVLQNSAPAAFGLLALLSALAWLRTRMFRPRSNDGGHEKAYADSVAALEAQLHRLSVDRQMLADEFAEARKGLESQIASVTTAAELSREEMASALDRAEREATNSRKEYSSLSARLDAEVRTSEQLREERARQQVEIETLRRRLAETASTPAKKVKKRPPATAATRRPSQYFSDEDEGHLEEEDANQPSSFGRTQLQKTTPPRKKAAPASPARKKKSKAANADELVAELRRQLELTRNKIAKNGGDLDDYDMDD